MQKKVCLLAITLGVSLASIETAAWADEKQPMIQDNSFLVEEAYNQEPNVMQSINAFSRPQSGQNWQYTLTQEFPLTAQTHQLSYTLAYQNIADSGLDATGLGDLLLNYRLQALGSGEDPIAFSPRLSLVIPSGNVSRGLGSGALGYQVNLPLSLQLAPFLVSHTNLGATLIPGAHNRVGDSATAVAFNVGQSFIWLLSPVFNPMLEALWTRSSAVTGPNQTSSDDSFVLNPGMRWALNLPGDLQVVPGLAAPIALTGSRQGEVSLILYLSLEHSMGQ